MQTIQPPFDAYKLRARYAIARYGSVSNVPGVRALREGGAYVGH